MVRTGAPRARWIGSSAALLALALVGCSGGGGTAAPAPDPIGARQPVEVADLGDGVTGLCLAGQAARGNPGAAKAIYDARARAAVEGTARALQPSYSLQASELTRAAERVDADLASHPPRTTLPDSLGLLAAAMREGLARLGVVTKACES